MVLPHRMVYGVNKQKLNCLNLFLWTDITWCVISLHPALSTVVKVNSRRKGISNNQNQASYTPRRLLRQSVNNLEY